MNLRNKLLIGFALLGLACHSDKKSKSEPRLSVLGTQLIEATSLMAMLEEDNLTIIDFRIPEAYELGHIPGAINIWRTDLVNSDFPYEGMMIEKKDLEELFGSLGINDTDHLIVYDDKGSADAARLRWILRYYYFDNIQILNGGLSAWKADGGGISKEKEKQKETIFTLVDSTRSHMLIEKDELRSKLPPYHKRFKILDVRSMDEYMGRTLKSGATKAGRIPGSIHLEWSEAIDKNSNNKFRSVDFLADLFKLHGIDRNDTVVVYCHSGSRSAHTSFVLEELLNYNWVRNYDGSWTEWSYYNDLPFESDSLIIANH